MSPLIVKLLFSLLFVLCAVSAGAQMLPNAYGSNISLENAKKAAAPALAEARKNNWTMVVAIVDAAGDLVYYEKMDNTQLGSSQVAIGKARSAVRFKRPTKAFQDAVAGGRAGGRTLGLGGGVAVPGGRSAAREGEIVRRRGEP